MANSKVLFVTQFFENTPNGPGRYAEYLWESFSDERDLEFHICSPDISDEVAFSDDRLHKVFLPKSGFQFYREFNRKVAEFATALGPDLILHLNAAHVHRPLLREGLPIIAQINDDSVTDVYRNASRMIRKDGLRRLLALLWRRQQERRMVQSQQFTVCNSDHTRKRVLDEYRPGDPDRVVTIHKAVDIEYYQRSNPVESRARSEGEGFNIAFVGSDWRRKGLDLLCRALGNTSIVRGTRLRVIGVEAPPHGSELDGIVAEAAIGGCIEWLGYQDRAGVRDVLADTDLFVLPSRQEALGVSIIEAQAMGVPVVASKVGGIPEIINSKDVGVLIEPDSVDKLSRALEHTIADLDLRRRLAKVGAENACRFSRHHMAARVLELYRKCHDERWSE